MNDQPGPGGGGPAAESALRQLRRRYDDLRNDYEALLNRIADAEEQAEQPEPPPVIPRLGILDYVLAPLAAIRDEYVETLEALDRVVDGIDGLLPRGMKSQRGALAGDADDERRIQLDVRGSGPRALLEFRERLAAMDGVEAVSIHAIDAERAVLVVELA